MAIAEITDPYLKRLAEIESGLNPMAANPKSSAKGLFQFIDPTARQYGLLGDGFDYRGDVNKELEAVKKFTEDNRRVLAKALGREPTPGELYLAHQQGAQGALNILSNPQAMAADVVGADAANLNAGQGMTAGDFAGQWTSKFGDLSGGMGQDTLMGGAGGDNLGFIQIEAPDGQIIEFPDTMTDDEIAAVMRKEYGGPEEKAPEKQKTTLEKVTTAVQGAPLSAAQGLTLGFGDELQGALAALPIMAGKAIQGQPVGLGEAYRTGRDISRQQQGAFQEQNPIISGGIELASGLAGGIGGAKALGTMAPRTTSALASLAKAAPVRMAAAGGALSGGLYGAGASEEEGLGRIPDALMGGGIGAITGGTVGAIANRLAPKNIQTSEELRQKGSALFQQAEKAGQGIDVADVDNFIGNLKSKVSTGRAGNVGRKYMGLVDDVLEDIETTFKGSKMTIAEANQLDSRLGDLIDSTSEFGKVDARGRQLLKIQRDLRDMVENAPGGDLSKEARKEWAKSYRVRDIERVIEKAQGQDQPGNAIRRGLNSILNNPERLKGYTKEEIAALRKAAKTGLPGELLRAVGSRLFGIAGAAMGGPAGAVTSVGAGMAAREIGKSAAENQALRAMEVIANRGNLQNIGSTIPAQIGSVSGRSVSALAQLNKEKKNQK